FDSAFHRRMPEVSQRLPLPRALWAKGIRRYGFHGLSYEYVVATVGAATLGRAVLAHLGNGASMAEVRYGLPVDTTMGLPPTGGALAAVLGGIGALVVTGGIGEHAAPVRREACAGLVHLGIRLDPERNARHDPVISADGSACTVRVVPTDEDLMIARHTRTVL